MKSNRTYFKDIPSSVYHDMLDFFVDEEHMTEYVTAMRKRKPADRESFEDWFEASYIRHALEWEDTKNLLNWWVTR